MNTNTQSCSPRELQVLDVFRRHVAAFTSGSLDSVMNDFDKQSVVITPAGVFNGTEQIRALYQELLGEFGVIDRGDSPGFSFDALHVHDDTLFIAWHAESVRHAYPFGTDTFVCNGDKFACQSIAYSPPLPRAGLAR